jgi:hypothetical protein
MKSQMSWHVVLVLFPWIVLPALSAEEKKVEPIDAMSRKAPPDTGDSAKVKVWFSSGAWHITWASKARDANGDVIKGEWYGRVVATDGTWVRLRTRSMEKGDSNDTFRDRAESKGNELRFTATTTSGRDDIIFTTDGTTVLFELSEGKKHVPTSAIFIGAKGENPSKVPFVLKQPEERSQGKGQGRGDGTGEGRKPRRGDGQGSRGPDEDGE